ncbi:MAG: anaerobic ribonucleoside-triphosphate reductase activating protein [Muribaculaceae bacterium]|nr:anaerobic ribonucleoside-triphosphate reductase activating protein [Muribaculaceae bacterium]
MRVLDIIAGTSVDGPGLRTSIYFAGCHHQCSGCHNPQSWNPDGGVDMTEKQLLDVIEREGFNVTFTGGDPMYIAHELLPLAQELKERGYNIWCYTGFTIEELYGREDCARLMEYIDTVVDGPFIESLRDTSLPFRGSSNQRIIHLKGGGGF